MKIRILVIILIVMLVKVFVWRRTNNPADNTTPTEVVNKKETLPKFSLVSTATRVIASEEVVKPKEDFELAREDVANVIVCKVNLDVCKDSLEKEIMINKSQKLKQAGHPVMVVCEVPLVDFCRSGERSFLVKRSMMSRILDRNISNIEKELKEREDVLDMEIEHLRSFLEQIEKDSLDQLEQPTLDYDQ